VRTSASRRSTILEVREMKLEGACETLLKQTVDKPPSSRPSSSASASSEAEVPVGSPVAVHVAPAPKGKATAKAPAPAPKGFKVLEPEGDLGPDSDADETALPSVKDYIYMKASLLRSIRA
jgi:hypothetical protein